MKFPKEHLKLMAWDDLDDDLYEVVKNESTGETSRWREWYVLVFKYEGKYYSSDYQLGLTENCDHDLWEYEDDEVECPEVKPVEKVVTTIEYINV